MLKLKTIFLIMVTIIIIVFLLSITFSNYRYKQDYENNYKNRDFIEGKVTGDFTFSGNSFIKLKDYYEITGKNWNVVVNNLTKIKVTNSTYEKVILTKNLTVIPSNGSYSSDFYVFTYEDKIKNLTGNLLYNKILSDSSGYELSLKFLCIRGYYQAELLNGAEFSFFRCDLKTDIENVTISSGGKIIIYTESNANLEINALNGTLFDIDPKWHKFPNILKLNGTIKITKFDGSIITDEFYIEKSSFTINSSKIEIRTLIHPQRGQRHGFGWAETPRYWKIRIYFDENSKINIIDGTKVPYWMSGVCFSSLPITIIVIFFGLYILYRLDKKNK